MVELTAVAVVAGCARAATTTGLDEEGRVRRPGLGPAVAANPVGARDPSYTFDFSDPRPDVDAHRRGLSLEIGLDSPDLMCMLSVYDGSHHVGPMPWWRERTSRHGRLRKLLPLCRGPHARSFPRYATEMA